MEPLPSEADVSEKFFVGLCQFVGTAQQIAIRRDPIYIAEIFTRHLSTELGTTNILSGSMKEGFRLMGSDEDIMIWQNNYRVLFDQSQSKYYQNFRDMKFILSDSSESPPGFTRLQLLEPSMITEMQTATVIINGRLYLSSSRFRQSTCSIAQTDSTEHGPCSSGNLVGVEYDFAICFVCDFWPQSASSWIERCHSWPSPKIVNDIVKNGCHFVAIGSPLGQHKNEEWRISFSEAEFKCVEAMNHSQFLTYGLLKIFLKEVINKESNETSCKLLCSYHLKTAVFWAIQQNLLNQWNPQNFLSGVWTCFKVLLQWVVNGVCPNFFIPENNMFLAKVHGSAKHSLFQQLYILYQNGPSCLLQSSSIRSAFNIAVCNPRKSICTNESVVPSEVVHDLELCISSINFLPLGQDSLGYTKALTFVERMLNLPLTRYNVVALQSLTAFFFFNIAFMLKNINTKPRVNKKLYITDKISRHMLKQAAGFRYVSDALYIAMYHYKTLRYRDALYLIEMTKKKLAKPYLMYHLDVDEKRYTEAVGGQSWTAKMRQAVANDIALDNSIVYIDELVPEQSSALRNKRLALNIPVFVMLYFLEFLCYRQFDTKHAQRALDELKFLVHQNREEKVPRQIRDISWEILGICQQLQNTEDSMQDALYSFRQSLAQDSYHKFQLATKQRIEDIELDNWWCRCRCCIL